MASEDWNYEYWNVTFPHAHVAQLEVNRPQKLNAFIEMYDDFHLNISYSVDSSPFPSLVKLEVLELLSPFSNAVFTLCRELPAKADTRC